MTADDCDDADATLGPVSADLDCDGLLNAADDDADGDGVLASGDCDDLDASVGAISVDLDCDGILNGDDDDVDGDGSLTADDCDDTNADFQTATTCEELAETCGTHSDSCGGFLDCGECETPVDAGASTTADAGSEEASFDAGSVGVDDNDSGVPQDFVADSGSLTNAFEDAGTLLGTDLMDSGIPPVLSEEDGGVVEGGVSIDAQVSITVPAAGEEVGGPWVRIEFSVSGCQISNPNQNSDGCHLSKWVDGEAYSDPSGGGERHYAPTPMQVFIDSGGTHTFKAVLMRNDVPDEAYVPEVSGSVTFELPSVASSSGDSEGGGDTGPTDYQAPARTPSGEDGGCACAARPADQKPLNGLLSMGLALGLFWRRRLKR